MFKRKSPVREFHDVDVVAPAFANCHTVIVKVFEVFFWFYNEFGIV